jgi:hypothetical protein
MNEEKPIIEEDILTAFDHKMIEEVKTIPQLKHWTEEQFRQYCLVLRCYSKMILSIVENKSETQRNNEKPVTQLTITMNPLKQVA